MTEHPILFSSPMVRAILGGCKTQTRRIVKPQPDLTKLGETVGPQGQRYYGKNAKPIESNGEWQFSIPGAALYPWRSPYGQPGDRLWVRETWRASCHCDDESPSQMAPRSADESVQVQYVADGAESMSCCSEWGKQRPSIFMPRWASRITLEVTGVRVERLQSISEEDAEAEGMRAQVGDGGGRGSGYKWHGIGYEGATAGHFHTPGGGRCSCKIAGPTPAQCAYRDLWDSINAKRAPWASNPWVWVIEFKRVAP